MLSGFRVGILDDLLYVGLLSASIATGTGTCTYSSEYTQLTITDKGMATSYNILVMEVVQVVQRPIKLFISSHNFRAIWFRCT